MESLTGNNNANRRLFLKQLALLGSSLTFMSGIPDRPPVSKTYLYIDESSSISNPLGPFVLGIIRTKEPAAAETAINALRIKHKFKYKLKYRTTDKFKVDFAKSLIDYFMHSADLAFGARVVGGRLDIAKPGLAQTSKVLYEETYRGTIADTIKDKGALVVNIRNQRSKIINHMPDNFAGITSVDTNVTSASNLCQLSDLLTGCIYGDHIQLDNEPKLAIINYLKQKFQVKKLSDITFKSTNGKLMIRAGNI